MSAETEEIPAETRHKVMQDLQVWAKEQGFSQSQVAEKLGIQRGSLSHFYRGTRTSNEDICKAASALMAPSPELAIHLADPKPAVMKTCRTCQQWVEKSHRCEKPKKATKKKRVAKLRTTPLKPGELPFAIAPVVPSVKKAVNRLTKKPVEPADTSWTPDAMEECRLAVPMAKIGMARAIGVSNRLYHSWIKGEKIPTARQQKNIARTINRLNAEQERQDITVQRASPLTTPPQSSRVRRSPTPEEIEATTSVLKAWITSMPAEQVTPDELVEVTKALIAGFTST